MEALAIGPVKRLLGMNLDGWLASGQRAEHYREFVTDGELRQLISWRLTHVRLPLEMALLATEDGWRVVDETIARCLRQGLGIVLALRLPRPSDHADLFASLGGWRALADCWKKLVARYRDAGALFDLLDRPQPPSSVSEDVLAELGAPRLSTAASRRPLVAEAARARVWGALATRLTQEVRDVSADAPLIVQSVDAQAAAFAHLRPTRDPHTRYSFHAFAPEPLTQRGEGTYPGDVAGERWDRDRLAREIEPALAFARTYEAPLYVGAFGVTAAAPRPSRLTWTRTLLSLCRNSGIGWAYWTYRHPDFGLAVEGAVDYDLLGVLQSE